jgi:LacI family transcriptional regulator/LacI family repressor for deo operon, udp, cdd, tsx, nupC, and nupG
MERRAISIRDIARAAGVAHTTVSRALHDSPLISEDVRSRVRLLAREMGYTPNAVAQSLRRQRTKAIGLVVTSIADPFVGLVVRGIEDVAHEANMSVFLSASYNDPEREMAVIEMFHRRRVDGIISAAAQISGRYAEQLAQTTVPTVLINQQAEGTSELLHSVNVDDYEGARRAVAHILELGHRSVGFIGAGNRTRSNRRRLAGYIDALQAGGIEAREEWIQITPAENRLHTDDVEGGVALLPRLLEAGVTAAFCYNDMIAVGALMACRERGIGVPGRLSVIGFDDIEISQYVTPPLTTMHQPRLRLGQAATKMLLCLMRDEAAENPVLTPELVRRASTAPPG